MLSVQQSIVDLRCCQDKQHGLTQNLRQATPHWTRHTHATKLRENGAKLITVRDNLRHASLPTTSMHLRVDDARRAKAGG